MHPENVLLISSPDIVDMILLQRCFFYLGKKKLHFRWNFSWSVWGRTIGKHRPLHVHWKSILRWISCFIKIPPFQIGSALMLVRWVSLIPIAKVNVIFPWATIQDFEYDHPLWQISRQPFHHGTSKNEPDFCKSSSSFRIVAESNYISDGKDWEVSLVSFPLFGFIDHGPTASIATSWKFHANTKSFSKSNGLEESKKIRRTNSSR